MKNHNIEQIAAEYGPKITSLCRRMIRDKEQAKDAAQDIWVEILKGLDGFRGESSLSTWLFTIANRRIFNNIKKEKTFSTRNLSLYFKKHEQDGIPEMMEVPQEDRIAWIKLQCSDCINAILHCLESEARMIYMLRVLTPLKYTEISEVVNKEADSVRQIFSRASRKINRFLSGNCCLYNPKGNCSCKMKKPLEAHNAYKEIEKISKGLAFVRSIDDLTSIKKNWLLPVT